MPTPEEMRLHRYIALCGVCSRRKAEDLIVEGRVSVNGDTVSELGTKVSSIDEVQVDGKTIALAELIYVVMFKPIGFITTMSDPAGRKTVQDLLPKLPTPVKPVGRLDVNTEGLLLLTNDGDLAMRLTHPRHSVPKTYIASVDGVPDERCLERLRRGINVEGRRTSPAVVKLISAHRNGRNSRIEITIKEGRNRQVRSMLAAAGHPVESLKRTVFGPLKLRGMKPGECRILGQKLVSQLRSRAGLD